MNWKLKAIIQNLVDRLPGDLAYSVYYQIQRNLGGWRKRNCYQHLRISLKIINAIKRNNYEIKNKTYFELGTGRTLNIPIGLWLCGASKIITVDLNPYINKDLVMNTIEWLRNNEEVVRHLFREFSETPQFNERFNRLITADNNLSALLDLLNVEYLSPADASSLPIKDGAIDIYYSNVVLEHIPPNVICSILTEAKRILSVTGLMVHGIDLSDHFAYGDKSITSVNFLQFNEEKWDKWSGNRFMYHNRLRAPEFYDLFRLQGLEILEKEEVVDEQALSLLNDKFSLDLRFNAYTPREL